MNTGRITRLEFLFQREIANIFIRQIKDPRIKLCTVSHVKISRDLSKAEIFLSIIGNDLEITRTMEGVDSAKGFIRSLLGKNLKIRQVPELHFFHDRNIEDGDRMVELIDRIVRDEELKK